MYQLLGLSNKLFLTEEYKTRIKATVRLSTHCECARCESDIMKSRMVITY